jgi:hypothetical protein
MAFEKFYLGNYGGFPKKISRLLYPHIRAHIRIHTHIHIDTYTQTCGHAHIHTCACVCCAHTYMYVCCTQHTLSFSHTRNTKAWHNKKNEKHTVQHTRLPPAKQVQKIHHPPRTILIQLGIMLLRNVQVPLSNTRAARSGSRLATDFS